MMYIQNSHEERNTLGIVRSEKVEKWESTIEFYGTSMVLKKVIEMVNFYQVSQPE